MEAESSEFQILLKDLIFVLETEDTNRLLAESDRQPIKELYDTIKECVEQARFNYLSEFQDSIDALTSVSLNQYEITSSEFQSIEKLHSFITRLVNSCFAHVDKEHAIFEGESITPLNEIATRRGLKKDTKKQDLEDKKFRSQKFALLQKMPDGTFIFSSAMRKPFLKEEYIDINGLQKLKVSASSTSNSKLGSLAAGSKSAANRKPVSRIRPVKILQRGPFDSFAPISDSSDATLSTTETLLCMKRKYNVFFEDDTVIEVKTTQEDVYDIIQKVTNKDAIEINQETIDQFKQDLGIDISSLLHDQDLENVGTLLKENAYLVLKLQQYQNERFLSGKEISDAEYDIAKRLEKQLRILVDRCPPSDVLTSSTLQAALVKLQMYAPGYKGTLTPMNPFSFSGNTVGQLPFLYVPGPQQQGMPNMPPHAAMPPNIPQGMPTPMGMNMPPSMNMPPGVMHIRPGMFPPPGSAPQPRRPQMSKPMAWATPV